MCTFILYKEHNLDIVNGHGCNKSIKKLFGDLKGYSDFKNPFSRLSLFGFNIMFGHMRIHIPNIGSLAHS